MKRGSTLFLKVVLLLIGTAVLTALIWLPQLEGRATNLDLISIYLDPVIIYSFIAFSPFFVALYQAVRLLGFIEQNKAFSQVAVNTLRNIKYCSLSFIGFMSLAVPWLLSMAQEDDAPGAVVILVVLIFATVVIATGVAVAQKLLQNAVDLKSENDLTV